MQPVSGRKITRHKASLYYASQTLWRGQAVHLRVCHDRQGHCRDAVHPLTIPEIRDVEQRGAGVRAGLTMYRGVGGCGGAWDQGTVLSVCRAATNPIGRIPL